MIDFQKVLTRIKDPIEHIAIDTIYGLGTMEFDNRDDAIAFLNILVDPEDSSLDLDDPAFDCVYRMIAWTKYSVYYSTDEISIEVPRHWDTVDPNFNDPPS